MKYTEIGAFRTITIKVKQLLEYVFNDAKLAVIKVIPIEQLLNSSVERFNLTV